MVYNLSLCPQLNGVKTYFFLFQFYQLLNLAVSQKSFWFFIDFLLIVFFYCWISILQQICSITYPLFREIHILFLVQPVWFIPTSSTSNLVYSHFVYSHFVYCPISSNWPIKDIIQSDNVFMHIIDYLNSVWCLFPQRSSLEIIHRSCMNVWQRFWTKYVRCIL